MVDHVTPFSAQEAVLMALMVCNFVAWFAVTEDATNFRAGDL